MVRSPTWRRASARGPSSYRPDMDLELGGKVFIVTGGSRGLGRATAEALRAEGAEVVLSARTEAAVRAAAAELGCVGIAGDLADEGLPARLVAAAQSSYGRVDGALVSVG